MLDSLARVALATEEDGVGAGGGTEGELVEGDSLTAGSDNAGTGSVREAEGGNRKLGDLDEALVVKDRADNDNGLRVVGVRATGLLDNARDRNGRTVDLARQPRPILLIALHTLLIKRRLRTTLLKRDSVRRARKR